MQPLRLQNLKEQHNFSFQSNAYHSESPYLLMLIWPFYSCDLHRPMNLIIGPDRDILQTYTCIQGRSQGEMGASPHETWVLPTDFCWTSAWNPALPIFSQALPTFATHIFSRRRFHSNRDRMSILCITLGKKLHFLSARSVLWLHVTQKYVKNAFPASAVLQTPRGSSLTLVKQFDDCLYKLTTDYIHLFNLKTVLFLLI